MEEDSSERSAPTPQLLNLIRGERGWKVGEAEGGSRSRNVISEAEEDRKLELKLGPPDVQGDDGTAARLGEKIQQHEESYTALSLGCFPAHSKLDTNTATTGAKRGFFATVDGKPEGRTGQRKIRRVIFHSVFTRVSFFLKKTKCFNISHLIQGCNQRQQDREGCENELTLVGENLAGEKKKGRCPPSSSHDSAARPMQGSNNPQGRGAVLPVVGWPPVRSFRRNLTNGSSSKQSPERQNDEVADKAKIDCKRSSSLIKINMDGILIGRKINLAAYDSFQKLSSAVEELFCGFLEAQKDLPCDESGEQGADEKIFSGLLDGTGEYTLVYEDNRGGRKLAGDLPWSVFASTAKRLRVMRSSELPHGMIKDTSGRVADN